MIELKGKAAEKGKEMKEKGKEKAKGVDKSLIKSKMGGLWKKMTGPKEMCACEKCAGRAILIKDCEQEKDGEDIEPKPDLGKAKDVKGAFDDENEMSHD